MTLHDLSHCYIHAVVGATCTIVHLSCTCLGAIIGVDRRPVARGVQTGAIAPPPPLDARSALQAMNIVHFIVQSTHILIRTAMCTIECMQEHWYGINSGYGSTLFAQGPPRILVCIYPVWIIIYHI